jgi:hypothetical protein
MKDNFVKFSWGKVSSILCIVALVLLLASCLDDDDDQQIQPVPVAYVSIYHESPNAPELDVFVDNRAVNRLEFTDYTGYLNFYTGNRNLKINPFNASNALVDTTMSFVDGAFYSVFIVNDLSKVETLAVRDSASAPASGKAKVRFINLSPDAPALDVTSNEASTPLFAGQAFKMPSEFVEVDAKEYSFDVKTSGGTESLVSVSDIDLRSGNFYTIITRGYSNPPAGNNNTLSIEVIRNL